jgi:BirA family biotin operon repressor/biotin-[acetyl-CoA-carboxylase] ligase
MDSGLDGGDHQPRHDNDPGQMLNAGLISNLMSPAARLQLLQLTVLDAVDSTNSALQRLPAKQQHAHAILAESQSKGRGRRSRQWFSPAECNIYLSFGWQFANGRQGLSIVPLVAAVCVCRALSRAGLEGHGIKWPNDVLIGDQKLAGILVEMQAVAGGPATGVIGVGLNVNMPPQSREGLEAGERIDRRWTDVSSHLNASGPVCRNTVAALLLDELIDGVRHYETHGFSLFQSDWKALDLLAGRRIEIQHQGRTLSGVARGIDAAGGLRVERGGEVGVFHAGEVSVFYD